MLKYQISITLIVPDCVFNCCERGEPIQAEVLVLLLQVALGGSNQRRNPLHLVLQSTPLGTVRYATSCRRSSACFAFIDNLLLTVPTAALPTPCFADCRDAQKLLTFGCGQGTELPSFCARTSGTFPLHGRYDRNLNTTPYYGY